MIFVVSALEGDVCGEAGAGFAGAVEAAGAVCTDAVWLSFLLSGLMTDGGCGTLPEVGLNTGLVGSGEVIGRPADGGVASDEEEVGADAGAVGMGGTAPDRMGAVFAVRARVNGERGPLGTSRGGGTLAP